jgi:PAS domain S-box-containing protein
VSPSVQALYGIPAQEFLGKTARELGIPLHDSEGFEESCKEVFETGRRVEKEFDYGGRWYSARIIPEVNGKDGVERVMCIEQDVTERKNSERDIRMLSARLLDIRDEERKRISRELHDSTAQNLFALDISLTHLVKVAPSEELKDMLTECKSLCEQSRKEIRTLSYLLHPPRLDEGGLVAAIKWYIQGFSQRSGIRVGFQGTSVTSGARLPLDIETDLFRVVQEGLSNVHRHSGSRVAIVTLEEKIDQVILAIKDWGTGIQDWNAMTMSAKAVGVGIPGMRERLGQLGGRLEIQSGKFGTTIRAIVPLVSGRSEMAEYSGEGDHQS